MKPIFLLAMMLLFSSCKTTTSNISDNEVLAEKPLESNGDIDNNNVQNIAEIKLAGKLAMTGSHVLEGDELLKLENEIKSYIAKDYSPLPNSLFYSRFYALSRNEDDAQITIAISDMALNTYASRHGFVYLAKSTFCDASAIVTVKRKNGTLLHTQKVNMDGYTRYNETNSKQKCNFEVAKKAIDYFIELGLRSYTNDQIRQQKSDLTKTAIFKVYPNQLKLNMIGKHIPNQEDQNTLRRAIVSYFESEFVPQRESGYSGFYAGYTKVAGEENFKIQITEVSFNSITLDFGTKYCNADVYFSIYDNENRLVDKLNTHFGGYSDTNRVTAFPRLKNDYCRDQMALAAIEKALERTFGNIFVRKL